MTLFFGAAQEAWGVKFTAGGWHLTSVKFTNFGVFEAPGGANTLEARCFGWNSAWSQVKDDLFVCLMPLEAAYEKSGPQDGKAERVLQRPNDQIFH